ncbi:MAG: Gfo/Idh/MocA family oxidoreductase [Ruminococcaceae bacterium]|nr:Gfo/Idh/MocA family oxidoreductase [Oscillospiraceae bacterium]
MKKFGFGIVGCGMIADLHADVIAGISRAAFVGVFDKDIDRASAFAEKKGAQKVYLSYEDMLSDSDIDIVCICTPSGLHAPLIIQAAESGKHFIVEKPMAITEEQLSSVISAVEKNHVKGEVISQYRFSLAVQTVKQAVERGQLGKIILADIYMKYHRSAEYYNSSWRGTKAMDGGGALMNQGIHGIDLLQYIVGDVKSVMGCCRTLLHNIEVEDTASLTVEYANGAIGTIQGTTSVNPGYPRRIEIHGTEGSVVLEEDRIVVWDIEGTPMPEQKEKSVTASHNNPMAISNKYHKIQFEDLISSIEEDREPLISVYEGKKPVDIVLAAYKSEKEGRKILL